METSDISITKLKKELKENYKIIDSLLKERNAIKKAYSMQIDLVQALEKRIEERDELIENLKNKIEQLDNPFDGLSGLNGIDSILEWNNVEDINIKEDMLYNDQLPSLISETNLKTESNIPRPSLQ